MGMGGWVAPAALGESPLEAWDLGNWGWGWGVKGDLA